MIKTKYITADEFKEYSGIDLALELKPDDNPSNQIDAFISRVEGWLERYVNANYYRDVAEEFKQFTDYQKSTYKIGIMEQIIYNLRNGDISTDSGYDDNGIHAKRPEIKELALAPNTKDCLVLCGLLTRKIKNRARGGLGGWWMY